MHVLRNFFPGESIGKQNGDIHRQFSTNCWKSLVVRAITGEVRRQQTDAANSIAS